LEYRDNNGETPLHWAAVKGSYNILEIILKKYKSLQKVPDPKNNVKYKIVTSNLFLLFYLL